MVVCFTAGNAGLSLKPWERFSPGLCSVELGRWGIRGLGLGDKDDNCRKG